MFQWFCYWWIISYRIFLLINDFEILVIIRQFRKKLPLLVVNPPEKFFTKKVSSNQKGWEPLVYSKLQIIFFGRNANRLLKRFCFRIHFSLSRRSRKIDNIRFDLIHYLGWMRKHFGRSLHSTKEIIKIKIRKNESCFSFKMYDEHTKLLHTIHIYRIHIVILIFYKKFCIW